MNNNDLVKQVHQGGTERPFTGEYWDHHEDGDYTCASCGTVLFESGTKLDSSKGPMGLRGWPAFQDAIPGTIEFKEDDSLGMRRTEALCANCGIHLGHLFDDPETTTGKHYCINSVCLGFEKND
jgi:peptide-methionine (R)-S-oxide reductase